MHTGRTADLLKPDGVAIFEQSRRKGRGWSDWRLYLPRIKTSGNKNTSHYRGIRLGMHINTKKDWKKTKNEFDTMTHNSGTVQLRSTERNGFTRQIPIVRRSQSRVLILREEWSIQVLPASLCPNQRPTLNLERCGTLATRLWTSESSFLSWRLAWPALGFRIWQMGSVEHFGPQINSPNIFITTSMARVNSKMCRPLLGGNSVLWSPSWQPAQGQHLCHGLSSSRQLPHRPYLGCTLSSPRQERNGYTVAFW